MQINIKHILIGWYNKIFLKEQDLANYRLDICKHCQHNVKFLGQDSCDLFGCLLDAKVRVRDEKCLINKW